MMERVCTAIAAKKFSFATTRCTIFVVVLKNKVSDCEKGHQTSAARMACTGKTIEMISDGIFLGHALWNREEANIRAKKVIRMGRKEGGAEWPIVAAAKAEENRK